MTPDPEKYFDAHLRIKQCLAEYATVNVGIGTNRFLAKLSAGLHKPERPGCHRRQ